MTSNLAECLTAAGMSRNASKILVHMMSAGTQLSKDIERACGMSQPDVSLALKEISRYLNVRKIHRMGKGRPHYEYKLSASPQKIFDDIAESERFKVVKIYSNLGRLSVLLGIKDAIGGDDE